jgi:arginase
MTRHIELYLVPYDSGHREIRTGCGPARFLERGVDQFLRDRGHQVSVRWIESHAALPTENGTTFELIRNLAGAVRSSVSRGALPVLLAGNCNSSVGALAGTGPTQPGLVWFDAHGDFNTPETTESGFLDGMGLAMATGRCWKTILSAVPGFAPLLEANVLHVGARDLDVEEERMLRASDVTLVAPGDLGAADVEKAVERALLDLRKRVGTIYLHIDIDVLDLGEVMPNHLAVPGGLSIQTVQACIRMAGELFDVCGCCLASYDPAYDVDDQVLRAGMRLLEAVVL